MIPINSSHRHNIFGLIHIIQGPKGFEAMRERSPDEVIITVSVAEVLLRRVVGAGIVGILWGKFLLTEINFY